MPKSKMVKEASVPYPASLATAAHMTQAEFEKQVRLMAALKMFELGKLSSGKAAELAGLSRVEFLQACAENGVSAFNCSPDELESELVREQTAAEKVSK